MRIGYFADGPWSHRALEKILINKDLDIKFVCARYENPDPELKRISQINKIPFFSTKNVNGQNFIEQLEIFKCNLFVSMSFNQIFKNQIIKSTRGGIINCHAGKLPYYRGRNLLNWALINNESEFGVTVHFVDEGIDTGDIILQKTFPITDEDDYSTLLSRSYEYCSELLIEALNNILQNNINKISQSSLGSEGFYCTQRRPGDEHLNWHQSARDVFNFVRAICHPGPQARTYIGKSEVKINRVKLIANAPKFKGIPGAVLCLEKKSFLVKTADSFVRVIEWDSDQKIKVGDRFNGHNCNC